MNKYITILTACLAFGITALLGFWLIPLLRKIKYGQPINNVGPTWHKDKQGTPTMGGLMMIAGITIAATVGGLLNKRWEISNEQLNLIPTHLVSGILMSLAFGFLGFIDDYVKIAKKNNDGLSAMTKTVFQVLIASCYLVSMYLYGDRSTVFTIPFIGSFDLGLFYYPAMVFVIFASVNAVNITDGIDGLCTCVTFVAALGFLIVCGILNYFEMSVLSSALAGGCMGFLIWNFHPAKVFMGDTGSLFLGGIVVAIAFGIRLPAILLLVGVAYVIDAGSVAIQVASFKLTGKRVFKMSPIHHSYEISGFSEEKIVLLFSAITLVGCVVAVISVMNLL